MLDNALIELIISTLIAGEVSAGIPGTPIAQSFQPTQQGTPSEPTAFIYKIGDKRYGGPFWADVWDDNTDTMVHTEKQKYETTFQLSALATQSASIENQYTAADILNFCASILQSQVSVAAFVAAGVGIERVNDIRNPYFQDDRQQFEASPSFDFVIAHDQIITSQMPIIQNTEFQIKSI